MWTPLRRGHERIFRQVISRLVGTNILSAVGRNPRLPAEAGRWRGPDFVLTKGFRSTSCVCSSTWRTRTYANHKRNGRRRLLIFTCPCPADFWRSRRDCTDEPFSTPAPAGVLAFGQPVRSGRPIRNTGGQSDNSSSWACRITGHDHK